MRVLTLSIGILFLLATLMPVVAFVPPPETVPGEVLVRSHQPIEVSSRKSKSAKGSSRFFTKATKLVPDFPGVEKAKVEIPAKDPRGHLYLLQGSETLPVEELIEAAKALPGVYQAEPNYIGTLAYIPSDPTYEETADHFAHIGLEEAWDVQQGADSSVIVAVIDSGVDPLHVDLDDAIHPDSWNFVEGNDHITDDRAHGTRVAGIIGAEGNNGIGIAGIAFGCQLLSLDVADASGLITTARVIAALDHAANLGAQVVNMSITFRGYSQMLEQACEEASQSAVLVAAAGNDNQGDTPVYPAFFNTVIGVGATTLTTNLRALFSNYNGALSGLVDLVAPGETIYTTIPGSMYDGDSSSGTSFSAPMVAGVAALLQANQPDQSANGIADHLKRTAVPLPSWASYGRLSARDALETPMLPLLSVESIEINDSLAWGATNNEDGSLDVSETVKLKITLRNNGSDASQVSATLSTIDPDVTISDNQGDWIDILSFASAGNTTNDFTLSLSSDSLAHLASLTLNVTANGGTYSDSLSLDLSCENEYGAADLILADTTFTNDKTWYAENGIVVFPGKTLTIEPGTKVEFAPGWGMEVLGTLDAQGTEEEPITFTLKEPPTEGSVPERTPDRGASGDIGPRTTFPDHAGAELVYVSATTGSDDTGIGSQEFPYQSINYAINNVIPSEATPAHVLVAGGWYNETFTLKSHLHIYGGYDPSTWIRDIAIHETTIDGTGHDVRIVEFGCSNDVVLDGCHVTNGIDGAIRLSWCVDEGYITNNTISHNSADIGAAVNVGIGYAQSINIENNLITNNSASYRAAGISINSQGAMITIEGNIFASNFAAQLTCIWIEQTAPGPVLPNAVIENNLIIDNISAVGGYGISAHYSNCYVGVYHNTIIVNTALSGSGAISLIFEAKGIISNNTVCDNISEGYAIEAGTFEGTVVDNNLVSNNGAYGIHASGGVLILQR